MPVHSSQHVRDIGMSIFTRLHDDVWPRSAWRVSMGAACARSPIRNGFFRTGAISVRDGWQRLSIVASLTVSALVEHQLATGGVDMDEVAIAEFPRQDA